MPEGNFAELEKPIEHRSAVEMLTVPERERMKYVSEAWREYLVDRGYEKVVLFANVGDALTDSGASQLEQSHAPVEAYAGRLDMAAMGIASEWTQEVFITDPSNLEAEDDMTAHIKAVIGSPSFEKTDREALESIMQDEATFVMPFIPTKELHEALGGRSLPPADRYNNKALMRDMVVEAAGEEFAMPGFSKRFDQDSRKDPEEYLDELAEEIIKELDTSKEGKVWVKHAGTSSGMSTMRVIAGEGVEAVRRRLKEQIFVSPSEGAEFAWEPDSVVVEHHVEFGEENGVGDFCLRGNILPDGQFVVQTAGRLICKDGEFMGMINASTEPRRPDQLEGLGLEYTVFQKAVEALERVTNEMHKDGYYGPLSVDFFADDQSVWLRDFNARDGGASVAANIKNHSPDELRLDVEMALESDREYSEQELNGLHMSLTDLDVFPYATAFTRYPSEDRDTYRYTLKMNVGVNDNHAPKLQSDANVNNYVRQAAATLSAHTGMRILSNV